MDKNEFIVLMKYPKLWLELGLLSDEIVVSQLNEYEPGNENASEHYRHGALHFWLAKNPTPEILVNLIRVAAEDPDPPMAEYFVNDYIRKHKNCNAMVRAAIEEMGF